jgi:hypothetical protein
LVLDERSRHELYLRLEEALGADAATTLMEHLPPTGWADVATKRDVDAVDVAMRGDLQGFEERVDLRFEALEGHMNLRLGAFEERVDLRFEALEGHMNLRLGAFEEHMNLRFEVLEGRFGAMETRSEATEHKLMAAFRGELQTALTAQGRQVAISLAGTAGVLSALAFTAARLTAG